MNLFDTLVVRSLPWVPRAVVGRVAKPYVAGETRDQALAVVAGLNRRKLRATVDVLGEDVTEAGATRGAVSAYLDLLDAIAAGSLDANVSLKLSQLGLKLDRKLCRDNLVEVVERAARHGNFVRIDMEDSSTTDATLELFRDLWPAHRNLGVVLQACLKRTPQDARDLARIGASVRVCKGIYIEPEAIAWRDRERVRAAFLETVAILLEGGSRVGIATHDEALVTGSEAILARLEPAARERAEFQMLLGVRERLRDEIVSRGHPLRVYVPFGEQWYAYSVRRLRENPTIARHVLRALVTGS